MKVLLGCSFCEARRVLSYGNKLLYRFGFCEKHCNPIYLGLLKFLRKLSLSLGRCWGYLDH